MAEVVLVLGGATLLALALATPGLAQTIVGGAIVLLALLVAWSVPRAATRRADKLPPAMRSNPTSMRRRWG